jgi:3-oxoadipate enol-lactonase
MTRTSVARRGRVSLHWESTGKGPPVLLIMGLGMNATGWWRTVPVLSRRFRVIAFDNRGTGRSSALSGSYSTEAMADDAAAVLDAAEVDDAHVYGFSLGGMVAQLLALRHPERVRSLVLGATHAGGMRAQRADPQTIAFFRRRAVLPAEEAAWASVPYGYGPTFRREHAGHIGEDIAQRLRFPIERRAYRAQLGAAFMHDSFRRLDSIAAPTLVVHGEVDRMVPVRNAELMAERIPDARLHVLPDVGHFYPTEEPGATEVIGSFLSGG